MPKSTILVHCLHGLRQPYLYKIRPSAQKRCANNPGYQIIQCNNEEQAQQLFKIKMEEYQQALNKSRVSILRANLEKRPTLPQAENSTPEQSKFIDPKQRTEREKVINQLLNKHGYPSQSPFKSSPIPVQPLDQYEGYFDGASKNNPGQASVGYLLKHYSTTLLAKGQLLGKFTNNQAELMSMGFLLAHSYCNGIQRLKIVGDSKIAIEFMKGNFIARHPNTTQLVSANKMIANFFESIKFRHVKRELNFEANKLASDAFGKKPSQKESKGKGK